MADEPTGRSPPRAGRACAASRGEGRREPIRHLGLEPANEATDLDDALRRVRQLEHAFREAAIGWVRADISWVAWANTDDALAMRKDPERLGRATPDDLAHLITALVRADRFNEGLLLDALQEGLLARIARRAAALAEELAD